MSAGPILMQMHYERYLQHYSSTLNNAIHSGLWEGEKLLKKEFYGIKLVEKHNCDCIEKVLHFCINFFWSAKISRLLRQSLDTRCLLIGLLLTSWSLATLYLSSVTLLVTVCFQKEI